MRTIKTILLSIIAILTILVLVQSCEKAENANLVGTHLLKKDKPKSVLGSNQKIDITLVSINDSRCPPDVQCVWEGYATADIKFKDENQEQTLSLCMLGCTVAAKPKQQSIVLDGINYTVKLIEIGDNTSTIVISKD